MTETPREQILTEAAGLITGDRNKTYGSPTENFSNTAALWNVQIGHKLKTPLTAADVAQLMVQLKMARMIAQPKRDNYVDAAGYLACGWECEEAIAEPEADSAQYFKIATWTKTPWYYRWASGVMTYTHEATFEREASECTPEDLILEGAIEIPIDEVPEWAR